MAGATCATEAQRLPRAAGYVRVSTTGQAEHGLSIDEQTRQLCAYIESQGWELAHIYVDAGISGGVPFAERPDGARALERAADLDRLVVTKGDRLGRNTVDSLNTCDRFKAQGCVVVALDAPFADDGQGRVLRTMLAAFAEYEREKFIQRGRDGAAAKARAGRPNGGKRPYGLRYVGDGGGLRVVETERPTVIRIFNEFAAGRSRTAIAGALELEGVPTATGGRWRESTVRGILFRAKYVQYDIVDQAMFDRAQHLLGTLSTRQRGRKPNGTHLFIGGMLRCECGEAMSPRTKGRHEFYYCGGRHKYGGEFCRMPASIRRKLIDEAVFDYFARVGLDVEASRAQMAEAKNRRLVEVSTLRDQARDDVLRAEERLARVRRDYVDGSLSAEDFNEFRDELTEALDGAKAEAVRLDEQHRAVVAAGETFDAEANVLAQLAEIRKAIAGEVKSAEGVDAVRAALSRLFTGLVLHPQQNPRLGRRSRDKPVQQGRSELVGAGDQYMIELAVRSEALQGYDEDFYPVLEREALGHNTRIGLPIR